MDRSLTQGDASSDGWRLGHALPQAAIPPLDQLDYPTADRLPRPLWSALELERDDV